MEANTKELQQLQRTLQTQESDLKALEHQLGEKDSMVSCRHLALQQGSPCPVPVLPLLI